jgi:hypothetical protein
MRINIPANTINPHLLLTKAGYHAHPNDSYVLSLGSGHYPRFHVYLQKSQQGDLSLNLHLDQTPAVYKGLKAHRGEKDTEVVQQEAERLKRWINYYGHKI